MPTDKSFKIQVPKVPKTLLGSGSDSQRTGAKGPLQNVKNDAISNLNPYQKSSGSKVNKGK